MIAHYRNKYDLSFCGTEPLFPEDDTPSNFKKRGEGFSLCPICANAMYAVLNVNDGERMELTTKVRDSGWKDEILNYMHLTSLIEERFPEGFAAVVQIMRTPVNTEQEDAEQAVQAIRAGTHQEVVDELRNGRKIQAIKAARRDTFLGLKEAKDLIEELEVKLGLRWPVPYSVQPAATLRNGLDPNGNPWR